MSFYDNTTGGDVSEEIFRGITVTKASRTACIICGHPTGDCKSTHSDGPRHIVTLGKDEELSEVDILAAIIAWALSQVEKTAEDERAMAIN